MKKDRATSKISTDLRAQAEEALQYRIPQELSAGDMESLIHELQVHQIELEMQNEELHRTQNELEESHNRYSNLYDFAPIGYFTFNKKGLTIEVNLTGANKLGIERSFLIKTPFSLYVALSSRDVFYQHLRKVFRTNTRQTCEIKLVDKNKNQFDARLESFAVQDSEGNFSQCRTAIIDITEHKRAEDTIHESEERYRTLVESAKDLIATVSPDGIITSLNPAFETITGWRREEWLGRNFQSLIHPEDLPMAMEAFQRIMSGEILPGSELRLLASAGDYVPVEYATTALMKDGEVIGNLSIVRNITERKRAEAKLQKSEEQFRTSIENMLDAFGIYSAVRDQSGSIIDFKVEYVNAAACESNMMTMEEQVGRGLLELLPSHRESGLFDEYCMVVETGKPLIKDSFIYEDIYSSVRRLQKAFDIQATKFGDGFVASWRDVTERMLAREALQKAHDELEIRVEERTAELARTNEDLHTEVAERKRAEEALARSSRKVSEILESITDGFMAIDNSWSFTYVNQRAAGNLGLKPEEIIGQNIWEKFPGIKDTDHEIYYRRAMQQHEPQYFEMHGVLTDKWYGIRVYPSAEGISVFWQDITERRRTEEALRKAHDELESRVRERTAELEEVDIKLKDEITEHKRAEDRIREQATFIEKAHDAIAVRDLENRLIYWNKSAEILYGWTKEEAMGKNADRLLYKEETPKLISAKRSVLENGEWVGELYQLTKGGKEIIVESRWTLMRDNGGKPKSILIINTDATEKKKLEAQFLRTQRMESIGTLAGGIAHDLNNVLTPVMLSIQILNEKLMDEQSQKLLNILQKNTQRGADLIKQVLSFARGVEGERKTVQIEKLIAEIGKVAKETFPRSIEIKTDVDKDLWDIIGDTTQLHQVLMNLCVNSRDAMPEGGKLTISAGNVSIDDVYARMHIDAKVGSYISISVSDTGTGIPTEIMDRIFDPFFTTKEQGKGTGLGLSTVLTIVKSHGGFIDVHSEVGIGTSFKVYLPAMAAAQTPEGDAPAPELQSGHGESVLIVDDEISILDVTGAALEQSGYRVLTAGDGVEAISLYAQNWEEIKVILMDMMMPVMDGPSCIHALRRINPKVKIIGVSGLTEKGRFEKNANIGVQAFLTKPYTSEMLLKTISQVISTE